MIEYDLKDVHIPQDKIPKIRICFINRCVCLINVASNINSKLQRHCHGGNTNNRYQTCITSVMNTILNMSSLV